MYVMLDKITECIFKADCLAWTYIVLKVGGLQPYTKCQCFWFLVIYCR